MKQPVFTGAAVAIITPMHADGTVNFEELGRIIDDQIAHGTDAIVICGTTGESAALSHEEHVECIRFAVKHTAKRVPVIAGTGSNDTAFAIEISKEAEEAGADALLLVTPYYNKTSQAGLIAHYTAIADAVHLPCILYNVPSRTGCNLTPATLAELAKHPNINGVKEASGNLGTIQRTRNLCPEDFFIWSGNDDETVPICALLAAPTRESTLEDESLYGMVVDILEEPAPGWYRVRTHYRYEGIVSADDLIVGDEAADAWAALPKKIVRNKNFCDVLSAPKVQGWSMAALPRGGVLSPVGQPEKGWQQVRLADGRTCFVPVSSL